MESFRQTVDELKKLSKEIYESRLTRMDWKKVGMFKKKYKKFRKDFIKYSFNKYKANDMTFIKFFKVVLKLVKFDYSLKVGKSDFSILKLLLK